MIRLLYISTTRQARSPDELADILRASRRNNAADGITGLLVAGGRRFLQVLEGPEDAVRTTYERISRDPRHIAPVILDTQIVTERMFGTWAMGFQPGGSAGTGAVDADVAALIAPIEDRTLKAYFQDFAVRHAA